MKRRIETTTSRTAQWTCLCRAISSLEKNRYYKSNDRLALSLLPGFLRQLLRIPFTGRLFLKIAAAQGIYEYVIARTQYIDTVFSQALSNQFPQILIFGAGFDTRALRFQEEARQTRIFELDAPATQKAKIGQYRKRHLSIPPHVVFIPIDFDRESLPVKLDQAGFNRDERSLIILEGVLMYLQPQSVDQTFHTIQKLAAPGSEIVFDYIYASVLRHENIYYGEKGMAESMAKTGEQWHFGIEKGEIGQFLSRYGFELHDHRDSRELEEMYFKDQPGRNVGRVNGTHCLARAVRI
ncbi:MAG: SAM-dependent methyltransferase [Deltaproteobacteria bacterium]|nr:SAM-dependent methyltransferase [Deltaproteobacteria bacterium]